MPLEDSSDGCYNERFSTYNLICQRLLSHSDFSHDLTFPYHVCKGRNIYYQHSFFGGPSWTHSQPVKQKPWKLSLLQKVHASEKKTKGEASNTVNNVKDAPQENIQRSTGDGMHGDEYHRQTVMEMIAQAYIENESGKDRVLMIFKKDHTGESSTEATYMYAAVLQTFLICFFMKYVPEWRLQKEEFIRLNRATVFRTRVEAVRRMNDAVTLKTLTEAAKFSSKITIFSASFMLLSQMIASYRNKTSVMEYAVAAGITGGFARLHLGLRGFIAGSALGTILGTLIGGAAYFMMHRLGINQEIRHLEALKSKIEVERSLIGEKAFQQKIKEITENKMAVTPSTV